MNNTEQSSNTEINKRAYKAIYDEIGIIGLMRFLRLKKLGEGDSTLLREALEKDLSWNDIEKTIKKIQKGA